MAGPNLLREVVHTRRITKDGERSNPVYRSFIASFDVASIGSRTILIK